VVFLNILFYMVHRDIFCKGMGNDDICDVLSYIDI
jgi:hypothetical protein